MSRQGGTRIGRSCAASTRAAAVILAGGKGTRLGALTRDECKPALPFAGAYRTIDFSMSNCVNSGLARIGIATQYKDANLVHHLQCEWQYSARRRGHQIDTWRAAALPRAAGYAGTADAVYQNWHRLCAWDTELVLVLAGDHVYRMDYRPLLERHVATGATATVGCIEVPLADAGQFGVMSIDRTNRIQRFVEKPRRPEPLPEKPDRVLASMGIYVFNRRFLGQLLAKDARDPASSHDFGRDLIPRIIETGRVYAYPFSEAAPVGRGYWRDVGTVDAYWRSHMELLDGMPGTAFDNKAWPVRNTMRGHHRLVRTACIEPSPPGSLLAANCRFHGATVRRSVVGANVVVAPGAEIVNAVILPNAIIGPHCRLTDVVVGAGTRVAPGTRIGPSSRSAAAGSPALLTAGSSVEGVRAPPSTAATSQGAMKRTGT